MTPERWQHIKTLLDSALGREPDERAAFLNQACASDSSLRREVESLIASYEQATSFIEEPAFEVLAESLADNQAESVVGRTLGYYKVLEQLGAGGMGEVYLAEDTRLGRRVALKMLPAHFTSDEERVRRFRREAHAASALNHPNILTIYEIGQTDSRHFIATEHIEGVTLREQMAGARMKSGEALDVAAQVASALTAAHQAEIIHRDIKPDNIMIRRDGYVKVLDFGLAKLTERETGESEVTTLTQTKQGVVMGTARYMSPEQARGLSVDARTDIFSFGVVLYEMVAGSAPFAGETVTDILAAILMVEPPPLHQSAPEVPDGLQQIVDKALRKDKEERYQTATELLTDLKRLKQRLEFETELERSMPPGRNRRKRSAAGGGRKTKAESPAGLGREPRPRTRRAAKSDTINSLAVLPLVNAGGDPNMEYLSDGLAESIISNLSQLPNLKVISRSSVSHYKGKEIDPQLVGRQLRVRALMTGRVVQRGDDLSISVELVDVQDRRLLWGQQYNRKITDVLIIQEEISREIVGKLRLRLTGEEQRRLRKRYTENTAAYQLYLKGRHYSGKFNEEGLKRGIESFKQAIDLDPNYALAYAGLADAYYGLSNLYLPPKEAMPKAKALAMKALELDETLAEAHASLAAVKSQYEWEWEAAEREYERALELNPGFASVHYFYSTYFLAKGRPEEALAKLKQAQELDPLSLTLAVIAVFPFYYAPPPLRQYDRAVEELRKVMDMEPNLSSAHSLRGGVYVEKGMYEEAVAEHKKAWELGNNLWDLAYLVRSYARAGRRDEARDALGELGGRAKREHVAANWIAAAYVGLGERDEALMWLEKAYEDRDENMTLLNVDPVFDSLRPDPRFRDLVRRIGLDKEDRHQTSEELIIGRNDLTSRSQSEAEPKPSAPPELEDESRPLGSLEQEIHFCTTSDGVRIAYATVGAGPPLLKAANWLNHLEFDWQSPIWRHLLEEFARDHLLVRYDERGNGLSDWNVENFTFEAFVEDLAAVVDAVGLRRFPILGISQGGPVAIAYAVRHPERVSHLILYGAYARGWAKRGSGEEIERRQAQLTLTKLGWGQDNPAFRQLWTTLYAPDATPEQARWFNDLQRVSTSPENAVRLFTEFGNLDVIDLLPQVKVPTLVLHCRDEAVAPFEEGRLLAASIPGARFVPLEGRNHLLLENEPARAKFITEVRRFLGAE